MKIKIDTMKAYIFLGGLIGIIDDTIYAFEIPKEETSITAYEYDKNENNLNNISFHSLPLPVVLKHQLVLQL